MLFRLQFLLVKAFTAALEFRLEAYDDPVAVRSRRTRIAVLSRTATFAIIFITVGLMLLDIPGVRDIGTTLLASAGLAALAVAIVLLVLRANFIVVVAAAAVVAAVLRALGWG